MYNLLSKEELEKLINDFPYYLSYVYHYINLPEATPLQNRIATIIGDNPDRLILEAARGVGKSYIGAIYATWRLLRNSNEKVLIISASSPKAIEIATFIRRLFDEVPLLQHLQPTDNQRDSVLAFDVAGADVSIAPSVAVAGITGQITGKRGSLIIGDDVEIPSNSATELMREKLLSRVEEFEALLIPDMPSSIIMLGTPQSMESIYNKIDYRTVVLPAQVPEDDTVYEGKLDDWILLQGKPGSPTDKIRFPTEELQKRQSGMSKATYKLQYMLDTTLTDAERFPLKQRDLVVTPLDKKEAPSITTYSTNNHIKDLPNVGFTGDTFVAPTRVDGYIKYDKIIMSIDPSSSGGDETAYCILGLLSGNVYLIAWGGYKFGSSDETLVKLAMKAEEYKVNEIVPERNFGAGVWTELFRKTLIQVYNCTIIDDFNVKGQKETRIITNIYPILEKHQLIVNEEALREELEWVQKSPTDNLQFSLMYQMTHITYDRGSIPHDDRLDCLSNGIMYLAEYLTVSAEDRLEDIKKKELEKWLYEKVYNKSSNIRNTNILGAIKRG